MCARADDELEDEFAVSIRRQRERIEEGRRTKDLSFWRYVGLIGAVGWSVVVPMALGVLLGSWLDRRYERGSAWTLALLLIGLAIGCYNAWRMISRE